MSQIGMSNRFHRAPGSGARNESERICVIVNPRAGGGRAGRRLDDLRRAVDRAFLNWEVRVTEAPRHATEIAAQAVEDGFQIVAAAGGDGTCHEVVNGLVKDRRPRSRAVAFAVVPFGTGSDLQKSLQVPSRVSEALWMAATGITLPTDVGVARIGLGPDVQDDYFINVAGFGLQGAVVERSNKMSKQWGGTATFLHATVRAALAYTPGRVSLRWTGPEGEQAWEGDVLSCFVANGRYCGGGMWVGKGGTMQDGYFDVTVLPVSGVVSQLARARRLYDGSLERWPGAMRFQASKIEVNPLGSGDVFVDLDGEMPGSLPASFEVIPRALHVRGGWVHSPLLER